MTSSPVPTRQRRDRCPGTFRPWVAADGLLVRLRVPGGQLPSRQLAALSQVATRFGDGQVHLTSRANLQIRGLPGAEQLPEAVVEAIGATGLLPAPSHDLVRNLLVSPLTGTTATSGHLDLRPVTAELDRAMRADPELAELPGRFLFVLDDGTGDLVARSCDLGAVALNADLAQLRIGDRFGPTLPWTLVSNTLVRLARTFLRLRGSSDTAPWHVAEYEAAGGCLGAGLADLAPLDPRAPDPRPPLPFGWHGDLEHRAVPPAGLDPRAVAEVVARGPHLVLTPWRGVLVPGPAPDNPPATTARLHHPLEESR